MSKSKKAIIIVAGGKGTRMGVSLPKQFLVLKGRPILMHTIDKFYNFDPEMKIILVLPRAEQEYWRKLCIKYGYNRPLELADGGETRFHSVKNGLARVTSEQWVGIHDGVRPFVSTDVIARCFEEVQKYEAVIPAIDIVETVRKIKKDNSHTVNRQEYCLVQTPQVFSTQLLKQAYCKDYQDKFTDDASVVESIGGKVKLIEGNRENIKVTTPFDLKIGETLV